MADTKCPHKLLKRQNVGGTSWYVCANPDCDALKVNGNPQKFTAVEWDGKVKVLNG